MVVVHHSAPVALGSAAVYAFFILSGFWITGAWNRKYSGYDFAPFVFIVSRLWRLWPAFLIAVVAASYFRDGFATLRLQDLSLFGARAHPLIPPAWSLDVEVQYYLLAPFLAAALARDKRLVWFLVAASVVFYVLYCVHVWVASPLAFLIFFALGIVASILDWRPATKTAVVSAAAFVLIVASAAVSEPVRQIIFTKTPDFFHAAWLNALLAIVAAPFVIWTCRQPSGGVDQIFGRMAYTVYLVHTPVLAISHDLAIHELAVAYPAILATSIVLLILEHPLEIARKRMLKALRDTDRGSR